MNTSRGNGIFDPTEFKEKLIHIIGLGNIGSHTAVALTRMGFENFVLYDFDKAEDVNISTQSFNNDHLGKLKIEAVKEQMLSINPECKVRLVDQALTKDSEEFEPLEPSLCFICGVDSIEVRKELKELIESSEYSNVPIIDGRLGKEQVEILFSENAEKWDVDIDQEDLVQAGCAEKYIAYTPLMSAALLSSTTKKLCTGEEIKKNVIFEFKSNTYLKLN